MSGASKSLSLWSDAFLFTLFSLLSYLLCAYLLSNCTYFHIRLNAPSNIAFHIWDVKSIQSHTYHQAKNEKQHHKPLLYMMLKGGLDARLVLEPHNPHYPAWSEGNARNLVF